MSLSRRIGLAFVGIVAALGLLVALRVRQETSPKALIRVVDLAGRPVSGAVIVPEGLRTKPGPYSSGWYAWRGTPNPPVTTDTGGEAWIPYPKYVFEKIETGTLCLRVNHRDFVPIRPERVVDTSLPAGTPIRERVSDFWARVGKRTLIAQPDPIILKSGAILKMIVPPDTLASKENPLLLQFSGMSEVGSNAWVRPEPGVIISRRLPEGTQAVRVVQFDAKDQPWFSDVQKVGVKVGQITEVVTDLRRGVNVRGQVDPGVPRPVVNGRVVGTVWPKGIQPRDDPPQWHTWSKIQEDGSFDLGGLPAGDLEVIAICNGFISTNASAGLTFRHPQQHVLGTNDLDIMMGMEPTARLEVTVLDDKGNPVAGAELSASPNVQYGHWAATIVASDLYRTGDWLQGLHQFGKWKPVADFSGVSDKSGLAVLPNLPIEVADFNLEHPTLDLPAVDDGNGQKNRAARVKLEPGKTNYLTVRLEPKGQAPIAHR